MKLRKTVLSICSAGAVLLFAYMLVFPSRVSASTAESLGFCARVLVPSMFVYLVLSRIIVTLPVTGFLCKKVGPEICMLLLGTLCGCPSGASNALVLYESGCINKKYAEYLCSFTGGVSVSFLLGFVGQALFEDIGVGVRLLVYQLVSCAACAVIMRLLMYGRNKAENPSLRFSSAVSLPKAVTGSADVLFTVCASVVFFSVIGNELAYIFGSVPFVGSALRLMLEFSSGCRYASEMNNPVEMCALTLGFSGICVLAQVAGIVGGKLSVKPYLTGKLVQGSLMYLLAVIFG